MPLDRLPVAARDRARELEPAVHDTANEGIERLGWSARGLEQRARSGPNRHQEVGCEGGACVIRGAPGVLELERSQAERLRQPESDRASLVGLRGYRAPGAVELLGSSGLRERLERVHPEPALVGVERCERSRPADVGDPRADRELAGDLRDRPVGNAQEDELRLGVAQAYATLGEPRAHRRADAPVRAHDSDALDHSLAPVPVWDTGLPG